MTRVHRNSPCPCGSGKKYKQCHGRAGATLTRPVALPMWAIVGMVVVAIGATALLFNASQRNRVPTPTMAPGAAATTSLPIGLTPGQPEPAPYQYDPATNRYWDPNHKHWHDGQPPDSSLRGAGAPPGTITPVQTTPPATSTTTAPARADTSK